MASPIGLLRRLEVQPHLPLDLRLGRGRRWRRARASTGRASASPPAGGSGVQAATSAHPAIVAPILTKPRTPSAKATPYSGRRNSDMTRSGGHKPVPVRGTPALSPCTNRVIAQQTRTSPPVRLLDDRHAGGSGAVARSGLVIRSPLLLPSQPVRLAPSLPRRCWPMCCPTRRGVVRRGRSLTSATQPRPGARMRVPPAGVPPGCSAPEPTPELVQCRSAASGPAQLVHIHTDQEACVGWSITPGREPPARPTSADRWPAGHSRVDGPVSTAQYARPRTPRAARA